MANSPSASAFCDSRSLMIVEPLLSESTQRCSACGYPRLLSEFRNRSRRCRHCCSAATLEWKRRNPEKVQANNLRHKRTHRENAKYAHLLKKYGVTRERYEQMLSEQRGCCAICKRLMGVPVVDHNHRTGQVRRLLCKDCNSGLGYFREDRHALLSAVQYLEAEDSRA